MKIFMASETCTKTLRNRPVRWYPLNSAYDPQQDVSFVSSDNAYGTNEQRNMMLLSWLYEGFTKDFLFDHLKVTVTTLTMMANNAYARFIRSFSEFIPLPKILLWVTLHINPCIIYDDASTVGSLLPAFTKWLYKTVIRM